MIFTVFCTLKTAYENIRETMRRVYGSGWKAQAEECLHSEGCERQTGSVHSANVRERANEVRECPETIRIISQIQDIRGSYLSDNSRRWTDSEQACLQSWLNIRRPNGNRVRSMRSSDESTRFSERIRKRRARRSRMLSQKLR